MRRAPGSQIIHIWVPDIQETKGGIQAFSRFIIRAITEILPNAQIAVFSKNDSALPEKEFANRVRLDCIGRWPPGQRTIAYGLLVMGNALRERPDLIISTHVNFAQFGFWLQKLAGLRFVAVAHGVDVWGLKHGMMRHSLRKADRLLAVSNFTRERMIEDLGVAPEQVGLLPNTFDMERYVPGPKPPFLLKRFGLEPNQPVILTVARLASADRYKGYDQVLRALHAVRAAVPDVRYIVAGRGPDRARVEALIEELGLADWVSLAGYVPDHELPAFYNLADVFAMPSKGEGFGIVFLEALGCGKPVIAGNKDGSVDAVLNGKAGVLIDPDNLEELQEALILTLTRRHPLAILQQPDELRAAAVAAYGFPAFKRALTENLELLLEGRK